MGLGPPLAALSAWIVYDPQGRILSAVDLGDGLWEIRLRGGWASVDPGNAPLLWSAMSNDDGMALPAAWDGTDVVQLGDETPLPGTSGLVVSAGWLSDVPNNGTTSFKFAALKAAGNTRYVSYLRGTVAAPVAPVWTLNPGPRMRLIRCKYPGRQGLAFMCADVRDGALQPPTGLVEGSYLNNVSYPTAGSPRAAYRGILLGRTSSTDGDRTLRLRVRAGMDRDTLQAGAGAQAEGAAKNVVILCDSLGAPPLAGYAPVALTMIEALLLRSGWQLPAPPVAFRGYHYPESSGQASLMRLGRCSCDVVSGLTAQAMAAGAATWAQTMATNGVQADRVYIEPAADDPDTRTVEQVLADRATTAAAYRQWHPNAVLVAVAPRSLGGTGRLEQRRQAILAGESWADALIPWSGYPLGSLAPDGIHPTLPPGDLYDPATWDTFDFTADGLAWLWYWVARDITGQDPPLKPGETAPVGGP